MDYLLPGYGDFGRPGSSSSVGEAAEFFSPQGLQAAPWSTTTILVADSGNRRVVEADIDNGMLVKVSLRLWRWVCRPCYGTGNFALLILFTWMCRCGSVTSTAPLG